MHNDNNSGQSTGNTNTSPQNTAGQSASSSGSASGWENLQPNVKAALANLSPPLTSIIVLNIESKNSTVRFYAMQGAIMGFAGLVGLLISGFLSAIFIGLLLMPLIFIAYFYFWIVLMYKAYKNEEYEIPYIGKLAREQLGK